MRHIPLFFALLTMGGCAGTLPADPSKMTPDQLKEMVKDRSASAACTLINSPWGVGRTVFVQLDKAAIPSGAVQVNQDCTMVITNTGKPALPVAPQ